MSATREVAACDRRPLQRCGTTPISIIKLKDFYTLLEDSLDRCEDVANVIEGIIIKNA